MTVINELSETEDGTVLMLCTPVRISNRSFVLGEYMEKNAKKAFHDELFELYIQRAYYMMEHKESSPEIEGEIKKLTKQYKVNCIKENRRDNNDKH